MKMLDVVARKPFNGQEGRVRPGQTLTVTEIRAKELRRNHLVWPEGGPAPAKPSTEEIRQAIGVLHRAGVFPPHVTVGEVIQEFESAIAARVDDGEPDAPGATGGPSSIDVADERQAQPPRDKRAPDPRTPERREEPPRENKGVESPNAGGLSQLHPDAASEAASAASALAGPGDDTRGGGDTTGGTVDGKGPEEAETTGADGEDHAPREALTTASLEGAATDTRPVGRPRRGTRTGD